MKKYILSLTLFILCMQAGEIEKEIQYAKDYGLAYCLDSFHQTMPSNDIGVAQSMYFQSMVIGHEAYTKIHNYIKKYISHNNVFDINPDNPKENEPVYFIMCLEMYKSKEFHTEIEKIVKSVFYKWENRK
ncbi:hypothetical protein T36_0500 [Helicobacter cinaedi]|uniref:hypothetical protein n=1 Tax=Helicobacter TaxID=209 RepID=UPI001F26DFEB|nr:hypothetical protein [Helicobacter cinaedi]BDB64053.1 hypothetical protein T36_0500 [Helicobacter cinaedi]